MGFGISITFKDFILIVPYYSASCDVLGGVINFDFVIPVVLFPDGGPSLSYCCSRS